MDTTHNCKLHKLYGKPKNHVVSDGQIEHRSVNSSLVITMFKANPQNYSKNSKAIQKKKRIFLV